MDQHPVGAGCVEIGDEWQRLPLGPGRDGGRPGLGCPAGLGDDHGQVVGLPPADVAAHRRATRVVGSDEHRLVEHGEPVLVDGHVGRGDHRDHTLDRLGRADLEGDESGVGSIGEHDDGVERPGRHPVGRVAGLAGDLPFGVAPDRRFADTAGHGRPPTARTA